MTGRASVLAVEERDSGAATSTQRAAAVSNMIAADRSAIGTIEACASGRPQCRLHTNDDASGSGEQLGV